MKNTLVFKLVRHAMATRFEFLLCGEEEGYLRSVAEEALDEVERLEEQLSLYIPTSDVSHINARAAFEPVRVEPRLFGLLQRAAKLSRWTDGAFDVTMTPLLTCWGFLDDMRKVPSKSEIEQALELVGMDKVVLSEETRSVQFAREGITIDLGGIGKGYALERAAEVVREHGITSALLHCGTSTIYAIGSPPDREGWPVGIASPVPGRGKERVAVVRLKDQALSTSSVMGKFFEKNGRRYGHVLDPRTGFPAEELLSASAVCPSPTDADALSTAFCVSGVGKARTYCEKHSGVGAILVRRSRDKAGPEVIRCGAAAGVGIVTG